MDIDPQMTIITIQIMFMLNIMKTTITIMMMMTARLAKYLKKKKQKIGQILI